MRLCVETLPSDNKSAAFVGAAAFVRLCVETKSRVNHRWELALAAAFVRLCVETFSTSISFGTDTSSRLRAAVC